MDIRQLRYFVAVAEELSFSRAARMLHIAQPPLSQQIRRLERDLGVVLFERNSRSVRLTNAGDALLTEARWVLSRTDRIRSRVTTAGQGESGYLSLASVPAGFAGLVGSLLRPFVAKYPDVRLSVRELNTRAQYDALETGQIDLGLVRSGIRSPNLASCAFYSERLYFALCAEHSMCHREEIALAELADEEFIAFSREIGKWHFDQIVQICQNAGFSPEIAHQCDSILAQLGMVASGLGVALVTELTTYLRMPGVRYRPVRDAEARAPLVAVWSEQHANPVRDNMLAALREWSPESITDETGTQRTRPH